MIVQRSTSQENWKCHWKLQYILQNPTELRKLRNFLSSGQLSHRSNHLILQFLPPEKDCEYVSDMNGKTLSTRKPFILIFTIWTTEWFPKQMSVNGWARSLCFVNQNFTLGSAACVIKHQALSKHPSGVYKSQQGSGSRRPLSPLGSQITCTLYNLMIITPLWAVKALRKGRCLSFTSALQTSPEMSSINIT